MESRSHDKTSGRLLAIIELGGYPNFTPLYRRVGYDVTLVNSMRKALAALKKASFDTVVAEFNYQHTFRDRMSNLESLLAVLERAPETRVIVFYEPEHLMQLESLRQQFTIHEALPFPVDEDALKKLLTQSD